MKFYDFENKKIEFALQERKEANEFFILTGDNGSGKSSLLLDIANKTRKQSKIKDKSFYSHNLYDATRVIACTLTPFSKFDSSLSYFSDDDFIKIGGGTGSLSKYSLIFQALVAFCDTDNLKKEIIEEVAKITKFPGVFRVRLSVNKSRLQMRPGLLENFNSITSNMLLNAGSFDLIMKPGTIDIVSRKASQEEFIFNSKIRKNETPDFYINNIIDNENKSEIINSILNFRRLGALRVNKIDFSSNENEWVPSENFSSGQLSFFVCMMILASTIKDGSTVLIDEPEVSLHPAWQRLYPKVLYKISNHFKFCKFFIATHSPIIVEESLRLGANVVNMGSKIDSLDKISLGDGQSIEGIYANYFNILTENSFFVKDLILNAVDSLSKNDKNGFLEYKKVLQEIKPKISDSSTKKIINEILKK